ncbi:hypothetical protein [Limisphaera sp. VF-2]|jgi:Tfp pilus assembly protein PilN|uniref:hypothetical protein n=1 Tax=Limisphaera sp. VF-2 TaxID=3400418 RepID=UPI0017799234|nr:hypothetical protein [Limisphaera sp.]
MPIRLNLLAEALEREEERRKDPVKRALLGAVGIVIASLLGSLLYYSQLLVKNSELARLQTEWELLRKEYEQTRENEKKLADVRQRLAALERLATNRFLHGNLLNALQKAAIPEVALTRFKVEQFYTLTEPTPARTNAAGRVTQPAKPATATERILVTLDARDESQRPGDMVTDYKDRIASVPLFRELLGTNGEVVLRNLSAPLQDTRSGQSYVTFSLEVRFPEKSR